MTNWILLIALFMYVPSVVRLLPPKTKHNDGSDGIRDVFAAVGMIVSIILVLSIPLSHIKPGIGGWQAAGYAGMAIAAGGFLIAPFWFVLRNLTRR